MEQAKSARRPRLLGVVGIGVVQAGASLLFNWNEISQIRETPDLYYSWVIPFFSVPIVIAIVSLIALFLIASRKRIGLIAGLGAWLISALFTVFSMIMMNAPVFNLTGVVNLIVDLTLTYCFVRYLMQPREQNGFI